MALERGFVPDEEEQARIYGAVIQAAAGRPVVIRTLDIGADKATAELHRCTGLNPALGVRGIRRHRIREPQELVVQLRAILRAAAGAPVGILFPMITHRNDLQWALERLEEARRGLGKSGVAYAVEIRVGAMVEVPAAAAAAGELLSEVDFISVGTNDLLQYFMGADRDNPEVLPYYDPLDPAFLWLLRHIIAEAVRIGRGDDVTLCGEIAGNPEVVPLLLQAGFRSLSISPQAAGAVREAVSRCSLAEG
jgi:phosphoenolpyruvate-protein kinase (PTS system EI component)